MSSPIPRFYRICFSFVNPVLSLWGAIGCIATPAAALEGYSPTYAFPPATETRFLLDIVAGLLFGLACWQVFLLRARPLDLGMWKILQASTIFIDLGMLGGVTRALLDTGRTHVTKWRAFEWMEIVINGLAMLIKLLFLLNVGVNKTRKKKT